jgi:hypothetical protein
MKTRQLLLAALTIPFVTACTQEATEAAAPPPAPAVPYNLAASIQDIMAGIVAPAADGVWGAVSFRSTADGPVEVVPETDEDWNAVRYQALQLIEAGNLLMMEDRPVAGPGQALAYSDLEGNLTAEQIQDAIGSQRIGFISFVQAFQNAAAESLAAIDARDTQRLSDSGGGLDEACENCHTTFWYLESQ